ncbi:MAG: molybdate ABC transporter substrate-binding protein [Acetatifactor sp.]|nr:molybdate ABC transporter substrate-binding protein [Acetatifactor sp.]
MRFVNERSQKRLHKRSVGSTKVVAAVLACVMLGLAGCGSATTGEQTPTNTLADTPTSETGTLAGTEESGERVELTILAAASLTDVCNEIKEKYEEANDNVTLTFSYGSSGALQTQIEEGAPADIFMSAAMKQMNVLDEEGLMETDTIVELLENKVVLIVPKDSELSITGFSDVAGDEVNLIGLGDPESVPVGQYAEEIFTSLGIFDAVKEKANYGTDVRNVLTWVETGVVDCGVVYATDANTTENVTVVSFAPDGSCTPVIYPVGMVKSSGNPEAARAFIAYLQSEEARQMFESYGFSAVQ